MQEGKITLRTIIEAKNIQHIARRKRTLTTITEDTNIRGSPQTRGYIHQSLLSCKNISQKGWLQSATTLLPYTQRQLCRQPNIWFIFQGKSFSQSTLLFWLYCFQMNIFNRSLGLNPTLYIPDIHTVGSMFKLKTSTQPGMKFRQL